MSQVKDALTLPLRHKGKLGVMVGSTLVFGFILFPFSDLSDLVTTQVAKLTNNAVFVQFSDLKMSLFPTPGMKLNDVYIEAPRTPPLNMNQLVVAPSVAGLIQQKPYGHVAAKGLFKGDVDIQVSKGARTENGNERQRVDIAAKQM